MGVRLREARHGRGTTRLGVWAVAVALAVPAAAQDLGPFRDAFSESLRQIQFAGAFGGLVLAADELELAGARYRLDDSVGTRLTTFALPFHTRLPSRPVGHPTLYLEGVFGRGVAHQEGEDIWSGALPELATAVSVDWTAVGGLVGAGPAWEPSPGLILTVLTNLGLSRVGSQADYSGPGAEFTAAALDGIAFNWRAWVLTWGGAARGEWTRPLGQALEARVVARYDFRWNQPIVTDDPAQDFDTRLQIATVRADLAGPTGLAPGGWRIGWRAIAGYRHFLEGNVFDARDLVQLGGNLEVFPADWVPGLSRITVGGAALLGGAIHGWTVGAGAGF